MLNDTVFFFVVIKKIIKYLKQFSKLNPAAGNSGARSVENIFVDLLF